MTKISSHGAQERQTPHITLGHLGLTTSLLTVVLDLGVVGGGGKGPGWLAARGNEGLLFRSPRGGKKPVELEWRKSRRCCLINTESQGFKEMGKAGREQAIVSATGLTPEEAGDGGSTDNTAGLKWGRKGTSHC